MGKPTKNTTLYRPGIAMLMAMLSLIIFSALALSIASMSQTNLAIAADHVHADRARASAESGHQILRYWLSRVTIPANTPSSQWFQTAVASLQADLQAQGITNITTQFDGTTLTIPAVSLDTTPTSAFTARLTPISTDTLQLDVTGIYRSFYKTIRTNYTFGTRPHSAFDFGIATKGPLSLAGNIQLEGVNVSIESDVYIESPDSDLALSIIGNSQIAGEVSIVNPNATVELQGGKAGIGGETGQDAIDNHVFIGVPPTEFPLPTPQQFEPLAVNIIDSTTDTSADATFENVRILPDTNPTFSGHVTLKGIVFIETPNVVTFTGTADVIGIIVGNGDPTDNSGTNQIIFQGNVISRSVEELPDEPQFEALRDQTGTFILAPGFAVSFGGSFESLNGAIAANGVQFFGNAGGVVKGSILNYADTPMTLTGNSDLFFNRSGIDHLPAGFVQEIVLHYDPQSYTELSATVP